ncbi:phosphotransferase family protein [Nocardiopsis sp. LOL_012]|uniref:phosphotransferase family protein n=1 Tax=Nocardiopsis sp. LOL_012 TaxID=3345409 RepID=UPI003A8B7D37
MADQGGGFTPGVAARLRLADDSGAFVKAMPVTHPLADAYRHEARIAAGLPSAAPVPRLLWHGTAEGWVVLVFDDVDGRHPDPTPGSADIEPVVDAIAAMSRTLTPCPVAELEPSSTARGAWLHGWELLAQDPPEDLGAWERQHLAELAKAETVWRSHADGPALVHGDIRPDHLLTTTGGHIAVVDWAHAFHGAPWQDIADLVPHLVMAGHTPAAEHHLAGVDTWEEADEEVLTSYAAAYAGYWTRMSRQPAPKGVPHLRPYLRRAAATALAWVRHRTGAA